MSSAVSRGEIESPLTDAEKSRYAHERCHAFTVAALKHRKASAPLVAEDQDGEVFHSATRIQNTRTIIDAEAAYQGIAAFKAAMDRKQRGETAVRQSSESEIESMVPGDKRRAIGQAMKPSLEVVRWAEDQALFSSAPQGSFDFGATGDMGTRTQRGLNFDNLTPGPLAKQQEKLLGICI